MNEREQWRRTMGLADCFLGLSAPTRVQLVSSLATTDAELTVVDLAKAVGIKASEVRYHLRKLVEAKLVERRSSGRQVLFRLRGPWVADVLAAATDGLFPASERSS